MASEIRSVTRRICHDGLLVLEPQELQVLLAVFMWQCFKSAGCVRTGPASRSELGTGQLQAEFLQCDRDEHHHLLGSECVQRLGIGGIVGAGASMSGVLVLVLRVSPGNPLKLRRIFPQAVPSEAATPSI